MVTSLTLHTSKHLEMIEIPYLKVDLAPKVRFQNPSFPTWSSNQMLTSRSEMSTNRAWKRVEGLILMEGCEGTRVKG